MASLDYMTFTPLRFAFQIVTGSHFHYEFSLRQEDPLTGEPTDLTSWTAKLDLRNPSGTMVVQFATSGKPGVITLRSDGSMALDLADEYTSALTPTVDPLRLSGFNQSLLLGDFILIDPLDGEAWCFYTGKGRVQKGLTN